MAFRVGVSLVAFKGVEELREFAEQTAGTGGPEIGFELSYTLARSELDRLAFITGRVLSAHAPCPAVEYYPNLGSGEEAVVAESLRAVERSAETVLRFGGRLIVLHPGYALDRPVYADFKRRKAQLEVLAADGEAEEGASKAGEAAEGASQGSQILVREGAVCRPEYHESQPYRSHLSLAVQNLATAAALCERRGVRLAIENLNPRLTYLFQKPEDLVLAVRRVEGLRICLDLGHLWISSLLYRFDYLEAVGELAGTGKVATVHVHNNGSRVEPAADGPGGGEGGSGNDLGRRGSAGAGPAAVRLSDDHAPFYRGRAPVPAALAILKAGGVENYIIEAVSEPEENLKRLLETLRAPQDAVEHP